MYFACDFHKTLVSYFGAPLCVLALFSIVQTSLDLHCVKGFSISIVLGGLTYTPLRRPKFPMFAFFAAHGLCMRVLLCLFVCLFVISDQNAACGIQFLAVSVTLGKMSKMVCLFYEF